MAADDLASGRSAGGSAGCEERFREQREVMVEQQLRRRGIHAESVLLAMREVPRHEFVPPEDREMAYADKAMLIGCGQTISQPLIVAMMASALELTGTEHVLDVGTGSGYNAAVLSRLGKEVFSIECRGDLAEAAREKLKKLGYENVHISTGDGSQGWPEMGPFDAIAVTAAAPALPLPLLDQLTEGGHLVIPVGDMENQELVQVIRRGNEYVHHTICPCRFVPLNGRYGFAVSPGR
jgi:protein-L-isoaspartate(D-aspartate) O-methyltransferase